MGYLKSIYRAMDPDIRLKIKYCFIPNGHKITLSNNVQLPMTFRRSIFLFAALLLATPALADDRAIVAAATANAVDALHDDVINARIDARYTVGDFINKAGGDSDLVKTLQRAEQIGGPRFSTDGQACQIKLEISGDRVARTIISVAASNPKKSPIPAEALAKELEDWRTRVFTGTGSSVSGSQAQFVRPSAQDESWNDVSDAARAAAVDAAKTDAAHWVLDGISSIPYAGGRTVGDALAVPAVKDSVSSWLSTRPVRQVEFQPNHVVELTLAVPASELADQFLAAAKHADLPQPDPSGVTKLKQDFMLKTPSAVGRATAGLGKPTTGGAIFAVVLPNRPPAWVEQPINAEGVAESKGSKLKTARAAESAAAVALRKQIDSLQLSATSTLGDAAKQDPSMDKAIQKVVDRAKVYKVDYRADGSVDVKSTINPRELWSAISDRE